MKRLLVFVLFMAVIAGCSRSVEQYHKGWPEKAPSDLKAGFVNPPAGYGNVPFYWWSADSLNIGRLEEQLEILSDAHTDGLCISYNHLHSDIDTLPDQKKHGTYGPLCKGTPQVLSEEWFSIWNRFSAKCAEKGIGLGMDDYVVGLPGNSTYRDKVDSSLGNYPGRLNRTFVHRDSVMPENVISSTATGDGFDVIYATASVELHPEYGKRLVESYFSNFESHMDAEGRRGMNYFFQDELEYDLNILSWCPGMDSIFKARKGYDIVPYLDRMFLKKDADIDEQTAKVRMDYAEILTDLAEERYFKPIYQWNADRGLIYGCDNYGRGMEPTSYLDYFRAVSWFTAPGNDAPSRGSSFRQTKVSSSISHMYNRPRTWLEAFHSMGWDANGGLLIRQLDHHLIAGGNLLCMHGLYYSTHGGWWEWAPPCFHFRMPYWPHMKHWLEYAERMCYLLSQGTHVCDVAVLYPTETMHAYPEARPDVMFEASMNLSNHGLDYDFVDFRSLQGASMEDGVMRIGDESYKVLVLADIKAVHAETLAKIKEFASSGGVVLTVGRTMAETAAFANYMPQSESLVNDIRKAVTVADFATSSGIGKVLHRHTPQYEVYMAMDVEEGDTVTFRSTGRPELWDAFHGTFTELPVVASDDVSRSIICPVKNRNSMLVVFSEGDYTLSAAVDDNVSDSVRITEITGDWNIEIIPTMDNTWGDFRLPATKGCIGVEAREMESDGVTSVYGYAPYMRMATAASNVDINGLLPTSGKKLEWEPYSFSWQYGVLDSPGSQGYHGLKAKVEDRFLILDKGAHQIFEGDLLVPSDGKYHVMSIGVVPYKVLIDDSEISTESDISLTAGWHKLNIAYASTKKTEYDFSELRGHMIDNRERGMVMVYPKGSTCSQGHPLADTIVASKWYGTDFVPLADKSGRDYTYTFETAPGTRSLEFKVHGKINSVKVDGKKISSEDCRIYYISDFNSGVSKVEVNAHPDAGYHAAAFFADPVKMKCEGGVMKAGNWTEAGALKFFSGGIRYSRDIELSASDRILLDLGMVDATAEVLLNGKLVDVLLKAPYSVDITDLAVQGTNHLEVLVYSSLSNHYQTQPSPYRGTPYAGLIGPVTISEIVKK